jgi:flagellar basal-body rod protein FlgF
MDVLSTGYSALDSQMKVVDAITNNLANAQTTGFKREFERILQNDGVMSVETHVDLSPGELMATGNELDVAIDGPGFFAIQTPAGVRYTRAGSFALSADGDLVTSDGMKVLSSSGTAINISGNVVDIQDSGTITVDGSETATLKIVTFPEAGQLEKESASRFIWRGSDQDIQNVAEPHVKGGYLERSNVNPVSEMVQLISASREFEAIQRTIRTVNGDMDGKLIQELGQLG